MAGAVSCKASWWKIKIWTYKVFCEWQELHAAVCSTELWGFWARLKYGFGSPLPDFSGFFFLPHSLTLFFSLVYVVLLEEERGGKRSSISFPSPPCLIIHYSTALALSHGLKGWIFINCWGYNYRALHPCLLPLSLRRSKQWNILAIRAESLSMQPSNCHLPPAQIASPHLTPPHTHPSHPQPYLAEFSKAAAKLETIAFVHEALPVTCLQ